MKVRIAYTIEVSDDYRRAINLRVGRPGLATRAEVKHWIEDHGSYYDEDLMEQLKEEDARESHEAETG